MIVILIKIKTHILHPTSQKTNNGPSFCVHGRNPDLMQK